MNILIKLTCLIGLVIAPILGSGHADNENAACCSSDKKEMVCKEGKCDLSKCATMTKEECAKMCEENGCTQECKDNCMSQYDENGKYIGDAHVHGPNCDHDHDADYEKRHQDKSPVVTQQETQSIQIKREIGKDGKEKATVNITSTVDGKESKTVKVLEGTKAEVDAKIAELDKK